MHPRNIFKNGVKFEALAQKYDFFKPFVVEEKPNKFGVDFDDREAVLALNKALLLENYNLDVEIPRTFLIPRIPLRVNYILWIEDLLKEFPADSDTKDTIRGLDIGTGPCAIYALLCARMNNWTMYGTDINEESVKLAKANVKKNNLEESVKIYAVSPESYFKEIFELSSHTFDFCMCNPPFFSDTKDLLVRPDNLRPSWEAKSEVPEEIKCAGGEVNFVWKMIVESKNHPVVRIFTTMVGVKKHLTTIIKRMKESGLNNFTTCTFHQGRTSRWGLAWSWDKTVKLTQNAQKPLKPTIFSSKFEDIPSFQEFMASLEKKFLSLKMKVDKISKDTLLVEAQTNTWSHSRRKRRMELRANAVSHQLESTAVHPAEELTDLNQEIKGSKNPRLESTLQDEATLVIDRNSNSCSLKDDEPRKDASCVPTTDKTEHIEPCLTFQVAGVRDSSAVILHMNYIKGSLGKDGVHQIMQFLKNSKL